MVTELNIPYTSSQGSDCPDPELFLAEELTKFGVAINEKVCREAAKSKTYTDVKVGEIKSQIDELSGNTNVLERMQAYIDFVASMDLNNDGQIDVVQQLNAQMNGITVQYNQLLVRVEQNTTRIASVENRLDNHISTCDNRFGILDGRVTEAIRLTSDNSQAIAGLTGVVNQAAQDARLANAATSTLAEDILQLEARLEDVSTFNNDEITGFINAGVCETSKRVVGGVVKGIADAMSSLSMDCDIYGDLDLGIPPTNSDPIEEDDTLPGESPETPETPDAPDNSNDPA